MASHLDEPVVVPLSVEDVMFLRAGLRQYLRFWERHVQEDGGATHSDDEHAELRRRVGELIWRLERATAPPGSRIQHSDEAVRPPGVTASPDLDSSHSFSVERQLPGGDWVSGWTRETQETQETLAWRGACTCGWRSGQISGDPATGQDDDASRERLYDWWNEHHLPPS